MQTLTIQSVSSDMPQVEALLSHFCDENRIANYSATITMAVLHAVNNAMQHGNAGNPQLSVTIGCGYCRGGVYFEVSDQGQGFDYQALSPTLLGAGSGTGLFIIHNLADRVSFSHGGSTIRMEFFIHGIDDRVATLRRQVLQHFLLPHSVTA